MSIVLDGTTGITTPGLTNTGTETIVNLTTTGNTILGDASTDTLNVGNGGLVKDASGNVGIGTASPGTILDIFKNTGNDNTLTTIRISTVTSPGDQFSFRLAASKNLVGAPYAQVMGPKDGNGWLAFTTGTSDTERMRIDSSGILLLGTTSPIVGNERFAISQPTAVAWAQAIQLANTANGTLYTNTSGTAAYTAVSFRNNGTTFSACGAITVSGTTTAYATSSDYRLKENVQPMTGALAKLAQLNPVTYNWKSTGETSEGFIAHELQAVVPECVVGEKDAVDAEGNPVYQGIDTSFLVATLTAAIQELKALVDTQASTITQLQADVAALQAPQGTP